MKQNLRTRQPLLRQGKSARQLTCPGNLTSLVFPESPEFGQSRCVLISFPARLS